jgi:hypothetical protein
MVAPARSNRTLRRPSDIPPPPGGDEYAISPDAIDEDIEARALAQERLEAAAERIERELRQAARAQEIHPEFLLLLAVTVVLTIGLGWQYPPQAFAFACGMASLAWLIATALYRVQSAYLDAVWWGLLIVYLTAVARAAWFTG